MLHLCVKIYEMKYLKMCFVLLLFTMQSVKSQEVENVLVKKDSIINVNTKDTTQLLKALIKEKALHERIIKLEKVIGKKETIELKSTFNQLTTILSLALITVLFLLFLLMFVQRNQQLKLRNELITYKQKALHLQMNPHFIFNCLGALSGFMINKETDRGVKYLAKFSKLMRLTLEYSQESLIPLEKEIESLDNYLELEKLRFDNKFDFTITKSQNIEDDMAIPPLLIQPLIENAINHGLIPQNGKGKIDLCFAVDDGNKIVCEILDNGVGINKSIEDKKGSVNVNKSMSLSIIKQRLNIIARETKKIAKLDLYQINDEAKQSKGTKVIMTLPIQYKN